MPIKQVTCSVCGETVNKAQTYFTGKGRACKKHEGVKEKRDTLQEQARAKAVQARESLIKRFERPEPIPMDFKPRCALCSTTGLHQREFFLRALIEMRKLEVLNGGPVNPFTLKAPIMDQPCIFLVPREKCPGNLYQKIRWELRAAIDICGFITLCGKCGEAYNIELMPKIEWEQLQAAGVAYNLFVKPGVDKVAGQELARDN